MQPKPPPRPAASLRGRVSLGAHLSIAGGLHLALERAVALRCTAVQLFTQSARQWGDRRLSGEEIRLFHETLARVGPLDVVVHAGYLLNLAASDRALRDRSVRALIGELERCEALGVPSLVLHPGAHVGAGEVRGLRAVAGAIRRAHRATRGFAVRTVLENTAGQGTGLGYVFAHLAEIIDRSGERDRLGLCFDTAHGFAAGYDFTRPAGYVALWDEIDRRIGLDRLRAIHLNDAKREAGSRIDRHAHIGQGRIGKRAFGWIMRDPRFARVPKILETPKEDDMDRTNLKILRSMARRPAGVPGLGGLRAAR